MKKTHTKEEHLSSDWADWLRRNELDTFDAWWDLPLTPVDKGNRSGDGWSTVAFFSKDGKSVYVKRQSGYLSRPLFGIPTAKAEQRKIGWYAKAGIPALNTVYFGWRKAGTKKQAILVTEALLGFAGLDQFYETATAMPQPKRAALIKAVGAAVRRLHAAGMLHHNLYPKHIFVREIEGGWQVRFIDLETSRPHLGLMPLKLRDLETLHRRAKGWSKTDRLRFLLAYQNVTCLDGDTRIIAKSLQGRLRDKLATSRFNLPSALTRRSAALVRTFAGFFGF